MSENNDIKTTEIKEESIKESENKPPVIRDYMKEIYDYLINDLKLHSVEIKNIDNDKQKPISDIRYKVQAGQSQYFAFISDVNKCYIEISGESLISIPINKEAEVEKYVLKLNTRMLNGKFVLLYNKDRNSFVIGFRVPIIKCAFSKEYVDICLDSVHYAFKNVMNDILKFAVEEETNTSKEKDEQEG